MSRRIAAWSIILTAIATSASGSVLDQSYEQPDVLIGGLSADVGTNSNGKIELAQSFTAGISGRLAEADLLLSGQLHQDLLLEVRRALPSGLPSEAPDALLGAAITEFAGGPSPFNNWVTFDFKGKGPKVTSGEHLALVLKVPGSELFSWAGDWTGPYGRGNASARSSASLGQWFTPAGPNADFAFRTYVEQVPEPSTLSIFVVGGIGAIAVARRRLRGRARIEG
jgi:hypothetical protein